MNRFLYPVWHGCTYEAEQEDKNKPIRPRGPKKERQAIKRPHFFTFNFRYLCLCVLIIMIIISKYVWMSYGTKRSLSFFFYQRIKRERGSVKNNVRVCSEYFFGWGSVIEISSLMAFSLQ